jgi:glycosyltransferase involved in cell wall biosynthesis
MKLLVVSSWMPYPPDNGSRLRAFRLLEELAGRHEITLLARGTPRDPRDVVQLRGLCRRLELVPPPLVESGRLGLGGLLSPVPRYYARTRSPRLSALIDDAAAGHDALLGLQIDVALPMLRAATLRPSVLDEIEVGMARERYMLEPHPVRRARRGLTWWKHRRFVRTLVDRFDRATVVSTPEREHLRAIGCPVDRIAIVPNGIDVPEAPPAVTRAVRLIYPGAVTYSANLDAVRFFVSEVLPLVRRSRPDLEFTVTGSTGGVDVSDLANVEGVTFTGWLDDAGPAIAESAACVVPVRVGGGTRLKVLQALALATPVVSTSKGIEGLDLAPERHVLVADTPEAFAAQVLRLLNDGDMAARLAAAGREFVRERYAWGPIARRLEAVIEAAVDDHRSRS